MSEPERPIERLLQVAGKERRKQAGGSFKLHPAMRRLLQGEVTHQYGATRRIPSQRRSWFRLWPKMAWSLGTFLVVGMAALVTWQSHLSTTHNTEPSADRSTSTNESVKDKGVVSAVPEPFTPVTEVKPSVTAPSTPTVADLRPSADVAPRTLPAPTRAASRSLEKDSVKLKAEEQAANFADSRTARSYTLSPEASPAQPKATAARAEGSPPAVATPSISGFRGDVAPVDSASLPGLPAPEPRQVSHAFLFNNSINTPVTNTLVSFTVQQNGTDLKVVDADGSIYTGQVLVPEVQAAPANRTSQISKSIAVGGAANQVPRGQGHNLAQAMSQNVLNFRVVGTNRSLNQQVVFTGNFVPADEMANAQVFSNVAALQNNRYGNQELFSKQLQLQQQVPWNNGRISGQAVLDNRQTIAVEARPAQK